MKRGLLFASVLACAVTPFDLNAASVPLTIQEALYTGSVAGISRTADPVSVGIPLPDDPVNGVTDVSQLTLTGASAGQFRVLGRWPSGRIKWVLVDTLVDIVAGQPNQSVALISGGSGNFGGANLAVDNGDGTITVNTTGGACGTAGAICFDVRKAMFNGVDRVRIGTTTVVASGASQGFVIAGPDPNAAYPGNVTCAPATGGTVCTTLYKSSNDPNSTVAIEENGPVKAVLKATFDHVDATGHVYMHGTARLYFFKNKSALKVTSILRNADYGTSNTFATAFKGHQGYELRLTPNITGTLTYSIANDTPTPTTGTLDTATGTDSAYIYQASSQAMQWKDWCPGTSGTPPCVPYTTDKGYSIVRNGSTVLSGSDTQYPQGWADISNSSGVGVEVGIYQMAAYWPKSLEFDGGGTDVRLGIWARENSQPYYTSWPKWDIHDLYLNFHASALSSPANSFLSFQHYLIGRAPVSAYNSAGVFEYQIADPAREDAYVKSVATSGGLNSNSACCRVDRGTTTNDGVNADNVLHIYRYYTWRSSGGYNQAEQRFSDVENFIRRGQTGRYLNSAHFYRLQAETLGPHADGFAWSAKSGTSEVDGFGQPTAVSTNCNGNGNGYCTSAMQLWKGGDVLEHYHWYGEPAFYFLTGDETYKDHMLSSMKDWYRNHYSYQGGWGLGKFGHLTVNGTSVTALDTPFDASYMTGGQIAIGNKPGDVYTIGAVTDSTHLTLTTSAGTQTNVPWAFDSGAYNSRSIAGVMFGATRFAKFLSDIGDPDVADVLLQAERVWKEQVKGPLCVSGYPAGCNLGTPNGGPWHTQGISPVRGMHYGAPGSSGNSATCPSWVGRPVGMFHMSLLMQGLWELAQTKGQSWSDYWNAIDAAYGLSQFDLGSEGFEDHGQSGYANQGFRYAIFLDRENQCNYNVGDVVNVGYASIANQTVWMPFFIQNYVTGSLDERKFQIALQRDMAALGMTTSDFGGYQIGAVLNSLWTETGATLQNIQLAKVQDNGGGSYTLSWVVPSGVQGNSAYRIKWGPKRIVDWIGFDAGTNTFVGDPTTTMNWFAATNVPATPLPGAGGSTQTFTVNTGVTGLSAGNFSVKAFVTGGAASSSPTSLTAVSGLAQSATVGTQVASPLSVKVSDSNGVGVAGVTVTFAVTAGGGTLSASSVVTDGNGIASTVLTLGAAPGTNTVTAASGTLAGSPLTFNVTGTAATATTLVLVSGSGQSGIAGQPLGAPFVVKIADSAGNGVAGVQVTFAVTAGGGALSAASASTNASGTASTTLTLGAAPGPNSVTASSGVVPGSPVTFTATGNAATPASLVLVSGSGQTGTVAQTLGAPLVVKVSDSSGNGLAGVQVTFSVTAGGGTLSSTAAATNTSGSASTTLTLGSNPGANTVTATTATLPGAAVTFTATGAAASTGSANVTWTRQAQTAGWPGNTGWNNIYFDPVSQQTLVYGVVAGSSDIYSSDLFFYNSGTNAWTHVGGYGSLVDTCQADTATWPGNRHPISQMAIDSKRNYLWLAGGVCQGNNLADLYYLQLNPNPMNDTWHKVTATQYPPYYAAAMAYDTDNDVLFLFGYDGGGATHDSWVFCPTTGTATPGVLTAKQTTAGCKKADDWNEVPPVGNVQPSGWAFGGMVYDPLTKKMIQYGGNSASGLISYNQTWAYDVPTHTWTRKALSTTAPPVAVGLVTAFPAMAYNTSTGKLLFHQVSNVGAPADWQYDPVADTWTRLSSTGGGAAIDAMMAYDSSRNTLITLSRSGPGILDVWQGALSSSSTVVKQPSPCDLNGDGIVDNLDVQLAISQAVGTTACGTADLVGDGTCIVVDVQRVVNAAGGGVCQVGR